MTQANDLKIVVSWLKQLAELTRPGSEPVTKDKLATYASFLLPDFPISAFTTGSVSALAKETEYFPALSRLHEGLHRWWQANRPPTPQPLALVHATTRADDIARQATNRASWNDPEAVRGSVRKVHAFVESTSIREQLGHTLGMAVYINAPHHLHLVPPGWWPEEALEAA